MDIDKLFGDEPTFMKIAEHYYNKNFGTMTKSELELLMFTILYEKRRKMDKPVDAVTLAFSLGISVQRVDGLLEKMMLKKSDDELSELKWKEKLSELIQKKAVTYDASEKSFSIIINDVFVFYKAVETLRKEELHYEETSKPRGLVLSEAAFVALAYVCCEDVRKKKKFEDAVNPHLSNPDISEMINGKSICASLLELGGGILLSSVRTLLNDKAAQSLEEICSIGIEKSKSRLKKRD